MKRTPAEIFFFACFAFAVVLCIATDRSILPTFVLLLPAILCAPRVEPQPQADKTPK